MAQTTFIAAGDAFVTRALPPQGYPGFQELQACICAHDVRFLNLETTFHDREGYPAAVSGGTWAMSDPALLDDMQRYGFNLFNTANNHSVDYGHGGVLATIRNLKERGMVFSGTGANLGEASRPCYLETEHARVALISVCNTADAAARAGAQSADMPGRPGLNCLRAVKRYHLDQQHYAMAQELVKVTGINNRMDRSIRNGYAVPRPEGVLPFGTEEFVLDDRCWVETKPNPKDMKRITDQIREARRQADVVLVSIHTHMCETVETNIPSQMLEEFSRGCIDAGAQVVIGHGPHELQGIELYGGGVIFYSIGNFIFQTETVALQPWDAYYNKGMPLDTEVGAYMDARSKNGTAGYGVKQEIWEAVMAGWTVEDGKVRQVQLHPVSLGRELPRSRKGVPVLTGDEKVLSYLAELSRPYGTEIRVEKGVGIIDLQEKRETK